VVEQFARDNEDKVTVIGLGTQDDEDLAADFLSRTGYGHPLLWDSGFDSWNHFGFRIQPSAALLAPDGEILETWVGLPLSEVRELI